MTAAVSTKVPGLWPRAELTSQQTEDMYVLLSRHFEGVTRRQFEQDLAEKNWVLEIRREGRLLGFSTLLVCETEFESEPLTAIYSGDTIMAPEAWGSPTLARTWIAAVNHLRGSWPERRCYWLLLTSGFRTYRFLPVFWREFFPRHDVPTPANHRRLLYHLAEVRYGTAFDSASGIVRFPNPQKLCESLRTTPTGRTHDPDIEFFLHTNPGHTGGDELVCITEIDETNLTAAGRRMVFGPQR